MNSENLVYYPIYSQGPSEGEKSKKRKTGEAGHARSFQSSHGLSGPEIF